MSDKQPKYKPVINREHPIAKEGGSGTQKIYRFNNEYGASVVQFKTMFGTTGSYTDNNNEWELAVIKFKGKENDNFELDYKTGVTEDVIGHLSEQEVENTLTKIKSLITEKPSKED